MPTLAKAIAQGRKIEGHRPWPRIQADDALWRTLTARLAEGRCSLLGLWGDVGAVHMALLDDAEKWIAVVTNECLDGRYPSVARFHPPALRFERAARDLFGLVPVGLPDVRPWLDHGRWGVIHPLNPPASSEAPVSPSYPFLAAEGEGLHQIPVGPVHAGIIEPGHFRFTAAGETVVRLEERLGYTHKGVEGLMIGKPIPEAAKLAGRVSGDSTLAYAYAFARAVEAATHCEPPPRAVWLRALMAELERLANHLGDIGAICNDASFALMQAHCAVLRERVLRAAGHCFSHRLMMDRVVPGGVMVDLSAEGAKEIRALLDFVRQAFPKLVTLYDNTASLQDRMVGTGCLSGELARQYACGGFVGRASGRSFDARKDLAYPPYDALTFETPTLDEGDVNARVWIRIREVEQSLTLIDAIVDRAPAGPIMVEPAAAAGEGIALVESFRGDVLTWVRLDEAGRINRCHIRDPSWLQWPLLEAAIGGNIVADFPLCNKSFNCSYSGHDL
jgi:Ni,Fe-hydrogenase III large subunit